MNVVIPVTLKLNVLKLNSHEMFRFHPNWEIWMQEKTPEMEVSSEVS